LSGACQPLPNWNIIARFVSVAAKELYPINGDPRSMTGQRVDLGATELAP